MNNNISKLFVFIFISLFSFYAHAHPFANKQWGHKTIITANYNSVEIDYIIEIPIFSLVYMMNDFKSKMNFKTLGEEEEKKFSQDLIEKLQEGLALKINEMTVSLDWNKKYSKQEDIIKGDPGFIEYVVHLIAPINEQDKKLTRVEILNKNYVKQQAVYLNALNSSDTIWIENSTVERTLQWKKGNSNRYIAFEFRQDKPIEKSNSSNKNSIASKKQTEFDQNNNSEQNTHFRDLIKKIKSKNISLHTFAVILIIALLLGGIHALTPGHGKALVAAYLVGSRGTIMHAFILGGIVTLTHVASVVLLGFIGLIAAKYVVPEYYTPFISLFSGCIIIIVGIWLFIKRIRIKFSSVPHRHDHSHPHYHHHHHHHDHLSKANSEMVSWKQLLLLGVSGGIVPCPSATVIMLTAIAIGRIGLGLITIFAFSLGLAVVLIIVGILVVTAAQSFNKFALSEKYIKWLPVLSSIVVTILGFLIVYQGFWLEWIRIE